MNWEEISFEEIENLGIVDPKLQGLFSRVANGLLKHRVMDREVVLANLQMVLEHPELFVKRREDKFKNLAKQIIKKRK